MSQVSNVFEILNVVVGDVSSSGAKVLPTLPIIVTAMGQDDNCLDSASDSVADADFNTCIVDIEVKELAAKGWCWLDDPKEIKHGIIDFIRTGLVQTVCDEEIRAALFSISGIKPHDLMGKATTDYVYRLTLAGTMYHVWKGKELQTIQEDRNG
ncbi:hypothetical protein LOK49_LG14G01052 [Camellia lanceoleosa]|uniref:Uncharacterized protein n=1 Tax=Camellia lanceoleosa TaxID=1840588 RepID=A0ACC0FC72_9ERIC|nr:hypothetical protein LOK49_LG14G01052 [Camellia lanceoleosa]